MGKWPGWKLRLAIFICKFAGFSSAPALRYRPSVSEVRRTL
jgi:hypothetical protein